MRQHAQGRHLAHLKLIADRCTQQHPQKLAEVHQHDDEAGRGKRVAQAFFHVRDGMHTDRGHHQQCQAVAGGQQPESAGSKRLAHRELHLHQRLGTAWPGRCGIERGVQAVNMLAVVFRAPAYHTRQRLAQHQSQHT